MWPAKAGLPEEIAFLRAYLRDERILHAAAVRARRWRVTASTALLAEGEISDTVYFRSLACHLDLPFLQGWPELDGGGDGVLALRAGRVRLADGGWLLAPSGRALQLLLAARRRGVPLDPIGAITTPAHLLALVGRRLPGQITPRIGSALARAVPHLSARDALRGSGGAAWGLAGVLCLVGLAVGARPIVDLLGLVFFAAMAFRLLVSAAGWQSHAHEAGHAREAVRAGAAEEPSLPDDRLPTYSVLVPLRDEAAVVPGLIDALAALDYPALGSKLTTSPLCQRFPLTYTAAWPTRKSSPLFAAR